MDEDNRVIRKIPYRDHFLTGITFEHYRFELLLPENYYILYEGIENQGPLDINGFISERYIYKNYRKKQRVSIINLNPKGIYSFKHCKEENTRYDNIIERYENFKHCKEKNTKYDNIIERYKNYVDCCTSMELDFDDMYVPTIIGMRFHVYDEDDRREKGYVLDMEEFIENDYMAGYIPVFARVKY